MSRSDILILIFGLSLFAAAVAIWIAFPLYKLTDGRVVRGKLWLPPHLPIRHSYDDLTDADKQRLSDDPGQSVILQNLKNMPRSFPATPIWLGNRSSKQKNSLILLPLVVGAIYFGLLRFRGIHANYQLIESRNANLVGVGWEGVNPDLRQSADARFDWLKLQVFVGKLEL